jgi:hypothetical protein
VTSPCELPLPGLQVLHFPLRGIITCQSRLCDEEDVVFLVRSSNDTQRLYAVLEQYILAFSKNQRVVLHVSATAQQNLAEISQWLRMIRATHTSAPRVQLNR